MALDPDQLHALRAVLRLGSFGGAAQELHITPSAVSQRIKALEEAVGTALVLRGQPSTGTAAGRRLAQHADDIALLEARLVRDLHLPLGDTTTRVRVAVNSDSLATWFIPAMAASAPLLFDLVLDNQDHTADWLRRGEVSAAVTVHAKPIPGCRLVPLGHLTYVATATPAFAARWFANGVDAASLARAPSLTFDTKDDLQRRWTEQLCGEQVPSPSHYIPSTQAFLDGALAGLGWCLNPIALAGDALRDGRLVALGGGAELRVPLAWQVSQIMAPALHDLTEAVVRGAEQLLRDNGRR